MRTRVLVVLLLGAAAVAGLAPAAHADSAGAVLRTAQAGMLDAGANHTCAILEGGAVRCWGRNANGQLGAGTAEPAIGDDETPNTFPVVDLGPGRTARAVTAGPVHTCAILDDGSVRCWGSGGAGRLGTGSPTQIGDNETPGSVPPLVLPAGRTARAISAGRGHTCVILDDGTVRCWGVNSSQQLGFDTAGEDFGDDPGETPATATPVAFGAGRTARAISAGADSTCAILDDASVRCWGQDNGAFDGPATPVDLGAGRTARAIAVGGPAGLPHACAILDDGTVRCWGANASGQLGYGSTGLIGDDEAVSSAGPVDLGAGRTAVMIAAGIATTCAVLDDGTARCWGDPGVGTYGNGSTTPIGDDEAVADGALSQFDAGVRPLVVTAGGPSTCWLLSTAHVACAGNSFPNGELGYGDTTARTTLTGAPVRLGEQLVRSQVDVALTASAGDPSPRRGESTTVAIAAANAGPDPTAGLVVGVALPAGLVLQSATPSQGVFDPDAGVWRPGPVAEGAAATLVLRVVATAEGAQTLTAAVNALPVLDPDSTAGVIAGEDDEAAAVLQVRPPAPAPAPDGGGGGGAAAGGGGGAPPVGGGAAPDVTPPTVTLRAPASTTLSALRRGLAVRALRQRAGGDLLRAASPAQDGPYRQRRRSRARDAAAPARLGCAHGDAQAAGAASRAAAGGVPARAPRDRDRRRGQQPDGGAGGPRDRTRPARSAELDVWAGISVGREARVEAPVPRVGAG